MSEFVTGPFVIFQVTCPFCQREVPLPSVVITPVLEMSPGANRLSVRLTDIPAVEHRCNLSKVA